MSSKKKIKKKAPPYPPLKAHYEETVYGAGVAIVRIPPDTTPTDREKALKEMRNLAKLHSDNNPIYW